MGEKAIDLKMTYLKNVNEKGLVSIWNISNFSFALGILKCHS